MKSITPTSRLKWLLILLLVGLIGCQETTVEQPAAPEFPPLSSLSEKQGKQKDVAIASRDKLFASLLAELVASLAENGPAKSIQVCKVRAPEIAKLVSLEPGLKIGRTSFKLRNPENKPPDWAKRLVQERVDKEVFVELPNQTLGALLPIHLKTTCVLCHGDDKQVMPDVKAAIVSNYPDDQATGFAEGDLRGYFWAEVAQPDQP